MLVNLSKKACDQLSLADMKGYDFPFVKISAQLETAEIPKVKTSCMFIKRGVATAHGGWSGYGYQILTHPEVLSLPKVTLLAERSGGIYYSHGNRLSITMPDMESEHILKDFQDVLMPVLLMSGWENKRNKGYMTHIRKHTDSLYVGYVPDSINYKVLAPLIRKHLYEPMGLTKKVLQHKCQRALTLGESK